MIALIYAGIVRVVAFPERGPSIVDTQTLQAMSCLNSSANCFNLPTLLAYRYDDV